MNIEHNDMILIAPKSEYRCGELQRNGLYHRCSRWYCRKCNLRIQRLWMRFMAYLRHTSKPRD